MNLKILNISKTYPNGVQALKKVSLNIPFGMYGLIGPNGSGKSSLMRTLATLQDPDQGQMFFNGLDITKHKEKIRQNLGYLPQEFGLYPKISCEDLLDYLATLKGFCDYKERQKTVQLLLDRANLTEFRKRRISTFSRGMKQRFGIAQALLGNPKLLIVDEPTSGLDPDERIHFYNVIKALEKSAVVILSTHLIEDVTQLCRRFAILYKGQVLAESQVEQALKDLNGKIWASTVEENQINQLEKDFLVLSKTLKAGKVNLRIFSQADPKKGFKNVSPLLEDFYFSYIKGFFIKSEK